MTSTVLFLPWLQIENPIVVGDVTLHPFAEALALAGKRREQLGLLRSPVIRSASSMTASGAHGMKPATQSLLRVSAFQ